jgi:hypothetical protein
MSAIAATETVPVNRAKVYRLPTSRPAPEQRILAVEFVSLEGAAGPRSAAAQPSQPRSPPLARAAPTTRPGTHKTGTTSMATSHIVTAGGGEQLIAGVLE